MEPRKYGIWRLSNVVTAVFFILAALVQLNDPDAPVWFVSKTRGQGDVGAGRLQNRLWWPESRNCQLLAHPTSPCSPWTWTNQEATNQISAPSGLGGAERRGRRAYQAAYAGPATLSAWEAWDAHAHNRRRRFMAAGFGVFAAALALQSIWLAWQLPGCRSVIGCEESREALGASMVSSWMWLLWRHGGESVHKSPWCLVVSLLPLILWATLIIADVRAFLCIPLT
ncbi:uncharacterized protein LOC135392484 [Ornithodoros turicata]|uniref:uncharacterized protein LOC135392484 n=1 Tax=Ornithodoros turicata TaxID=34597 RepID=UPI0031396A28